MIKILRYLSIFILVFAVYHTVRDVLQIVGVHNWTTDAFNVHKNWCKPFCDYYTLPWDIFVLIGSLVLLKRNKFDLLGKLVIVSFIIWPIVLVFNWLLG